MLTDRDLARLKGVHPDLIRVVKFAAGVDPNFIVHEGVRSLKRQRELYEAGASRTMKSRHLTGHAVDLVVVVGGKAVWHWAAYKKLSEVVKLAAVKCGTKLEWGGDWKSFKDGPHFQLPWRDYP